MLFIAAYHRRCELGEIAGWRLRLIRPTPIGSPAKRSAAGNRSGVNVIAMHPAQYSYFSAPVP